MKRLIDCEAPDAATRRARGVLRQVRPLAECEARLQRVRRAIESSPVPRRSSRRLPFVRPARGPRALAIAILAGVGISAAAAGSAWWTNTGESTGERTRIVDARAVPQASALPTSSAPPARPQPPTQPSPGEDADASRDTEPARDVFPAARPTATHPLDATHLPDATQAAANPRESVTASRQPTEVERLHAAATALRRDRDPERALQLLEGMGTNGSGALEEETLALRVEAAARAGDPRTPHLVRTYLSRFPTGRYAERVRESLRPSSEP